MPRYVVVIYKRIYGGDDYRVSATHDTLAAALDAAALVLKEFPEFEVGVYEDSSRTSEE